MTPDFGSDVESVKIKDTKSKKATKKKKGKVKQESSDDDEFDQLLADLNALDVNNSKDDVKEVKKEDPPRAESREEDKEDEDIEGAKEVSSKTLKNKAKKEKKKQAKLQQKQEDDAKEQTAPAPTSKKPISNAAKLAAEMQRKMKELEEQAKREEEERIRLEEEQRRREEEEERNRLMLLEKKRQQRKEKKERLKKEGKLLSAKEKLAMQMNKKFLEQMGLNNLSVGNTDEKQSTSTIKAVTKKPRKVRKFDNPEDTPNGDVNEVVGKEEEYTDSSESVVDNWEEIDSEGDRSTSKITKSKGKDRKREEHSDDGEDDIYDYRSPICCVLGHVDTGKTKLLDKIRHSNVQNAEAGGITQQIGATFFPKEMLDMHCKKVTDGLVVKSPGLLIIDTPGHESFNNLRARGSSLCDIAILVVDIMHGLEPQTLESIELLKARKCYFVIALNKIDRIYNWNSTPWSEFMATFNNQTDDSKAEFNERTKNIMLELSEKGLNSSLYWENDNIRKNVSICPTSAITGEGIPNLIALVVELTQFLMVKKLTYTGNLKCSVLEVKTIEGLGTTVDVILLDGVLREGDKVVLCGLSGPIVTTIRTLLTPQPLSELRIKGEYIKHSNIRAAMGVKIVAPGLEEAVAGTELYVVDEDEGNLDELCEYVMSDMSTIFDSVDRTGIGVYVMASTLGSLEALLQFLKDKKISVFAVNLGTVQKKDVKRASVMREKGHPEFSVILAFDIKVTPDAEKEAEVLGVKIMSADIIYHLLDSFLKYLEEQQEIKKQSQIATVVFPCELTILPNCIFNKKDPFVFGVRVDNGILKTNTPLVALNRGSQLFIGRVASLEHNKKAVEKAVKGQEICIKVVGEPTIAYGRHFDHTAKLVSKISRESIDVLKSYFRDEMTMDGWKLAAQLKKVFGIP